VVSFTPRRLHPRGKSRSTHWIGGLVGPRACLDAMEHRKSLVPAGNQTLSVQSVACRHTDWAIPPPTQCTVHNISGMCCAIFCYFQVGLLYETKTSEAENLWGLWVSVPNRFYDQDYYLLLALLLLLLDAGWRGSRRRGMSVREWPFLSVNGGAVIWKSLRWVVLSHICNRLAYSRWN
jgi:hypothetical protein